MRITFAICVLLTHQTILSEAIETGKLLADRKQLDDPKAMRTVLVEKYGFSPVKFTTDTKEILSGLWYQKPDATRTVVLCAGFYPGLKESMASFLHLMPQKTNFLLFDARGHGQSEGKFWTYRGKYGLQEYKDVLAALDFVKSKTTDAQKPTNNYVYAYCMGGLHATHALVTLSQQNKLLAYNIKGFICDSTAQSLLDIKDMLINHILTLTLPRMLGYRSTELKKSSWYYWTKLLVGMPLALLQTMLVNHELHMNDARVRTDNKVSALACPTFFIHSDKDNYICSKGTVELAKNTPENALWLLEHETNHFSHHLNPCWEPQYIKKIALFMRLCEQLQTHKKALSIRLCEKS